MRMYTPSTFYMKAAVSKHFTSISGRIALLSLVLSLSTHRSHTIVHMSQKGMDNGKTKRVHKFFSLLLFDIFYRPIIKTLFFMWKVFLVGQLPFNNPLSPNMLVASSYWMRSVKACCDWSRRTGVVRSYWLPRRNVLAKLRPKARVRGQTQATPAKPNI